MAHASSRCLSNKWRLQLLHPIKNFVLFDGNTSIGRSESADIISKSPICSQSHCVITINADGTVVVSDESSTNGTFVNENRIKGEIHPLAHGDLIGLGCSKVEHDAQLQDPNKNWMFQLQDLSLVNSVDVDLLSDEEGEDMGDGVGVGVDAAIGAKAIGEPSATPPPAKMQKLDKSEPNPTIRNFFSTVSRTVNLPPAPKKKIDMRKVVSGEVFDDSYDGIRHVCLLKIGNEAVSWDMVKSEFGQQKFNKGKVLCTRKTPEEAFAAGIRLIKDVLHIRLNETVNTSHVQLPNVSNLYTVAIPNEKRYDGKCITVQHAREKSRSATFLDTVKRNGSKYTVEYLQIESVDKMYDDLTERTGVSGVAEYTLLKFLGMEDEESDYLNIVFNKTVDRYRDKSVATLVDRILFPEEQHSVGFAFKVLLHRKTQTVATHILPAHVGYGWMYLRCPFAHCNFIAKASQTMLKHYTTHQNEDGWKPKTKFTMECPECSQTLSCLKSCATHAASRHPRFMIPSIKELQVAQLEEYQ